MEQGRNFDVSWRLMNEMHFLRFGKPQLEPFLSFVAVNQNIYYAIDLRLAMHSNLEAKTLTLVNLLLSQSTWVDGCYLP